MDSAHSTAVTAEIRKLSVAAHSQMPFARPTSAASDIKISPWPAALTLLGEIFRRFCDGDVIASQRFR